MCFHKWSKWIDKWIESWSPLLSWFGQERPSVEIGQVRVCLKCGKKQIRRID